MWHLLWIRESKKNTHFNTFFWNIFLWRLAFLGALFTRLLKLDQDHWCLMSLLCFNKLGAVHIFFVNYDQFRILNAEIKNIGHYSLRPTKIVPFFHFCPSHKICLISLFTSFGSGPHIPLTHSYSYFIIKLIL